MPNNPQAYPCLDSSGYGLPMRDPGMTLRDWFAGQALTVLLGSLAGVASTHEGLLKSYARQAYEYADAMLAEREKEARDAS